MARIAFIVKSFPKLSETFIQNQVTGLIDAGHEPDIYALDAPDETQSHSEISEYNLESRTTYLEVSEVYAVMQGGINVIQDVFNNPKYPKSLVEYGLDAVRLEDVMRYRSEPIISQLDQYDAIHAHFGPIGNAFSFLSELTEKPYIVSYYGYDASEYLRKHPDRYSNLFERSDTITVLSEDMRGDLIEAGCPEADTEIVPLAVDTEKFEFRKRTSHDGPVEILTVARLVEKKGIKFAIDAISTLVTDYDIQYTIAGDGPLRDELERRVKKREITDSVEFYGWADSEEVRELMRKADVFLLPSITAESGDQEGTPTVLLESQAMGLPVVSTKHAGIPEIVSDGESGYLVSERDTAGLVDRLELLITSPEEWSEMGSAGRGYVEETHGVDSIVKILSNIYEIE